jgi:hypothetical protein
MALKVAVAAPFRQEGKRELAGSEFVVALSLDRDWYSPDQAKRLLDRAAGEGLLERTDDGVRATFDPESVAVPGEFAPDESLLAGRSAFEQVLDDLVAAGADKREAVAAVNDLQDRLGVSIEAAAVLHARSEGVDASDAARSALVDLRADGPAAGDDEGATPSEGRDDPAERAEQEA